MSTLLGHVIDKAKRTHPDVTPEEIAIAASICAGAVVFVIGITRLGFIVEFIPLTAIAAYMTGSGECSIPSYWRLTVRIRW
jgi:solute carrier family 26 (sodium-independent sulfate anion transporter), member 11